MLPLLVSAAALLPGAALRTRSARHGAVACSLSPLDATIEPRSCMGTWYVQRQIPALSFLEAGARNGVEQYSWRDDADGLGGFSVTYTLNRRGAPDDKVTTVRQRGWVASAAGTEWEVAPLLPGGICPPVRLPFVILALEPESHMVCSGGLDSWMYVMTRERQPDGALLESLMATVREAGFDMEKVLPMEHT